MSRSIGRSESVAVQEADVGALRELYKTLEFSSLLRDLAPAEKSTADLDYAQLEDQAGLDAWLASNEGEMAVAVGDVMEQAVFGLCAKCGVARSISLEAIPSRAAVAHDIKNLLRRFDDVPSLKHDVMLYGFLLSADPGGCSLPSLAEKYLEQALEADPSSHADATLALYRKLRPEVEALGLVELYESIDLPLVRVLARMEETGIRVDPDQLKVLSGRMEEEISNLSSAIFELSGRPFNVNSPQQLGKVLFEEMKLPAPVKYGKGKVISTAADVLETLALEHPIAQKVLEYRQLAKLKGTYVDALPLLIDPASERLHTTFNQAGAATGRLSSSNPNLQNIPIPNGIGPGDSRGVCAPARVEVDCRGLFAD